MNRIREFRQKAGVGLVDFAVSVGIDVVELALAEMGVGLVRFDCAIEIANALEIHPAVLFPAARQQIEEVAELEGEELRVAMLARADSIAAAGLDPDLMNWYAVVRLASGNTCKYCVTSHEMDRIRQKLCGGGSGGFVSILADCRTVVLRTEAVSEIVFTNATSYAPFSSENSAFEIVLVSAVSPRPELIEVIPDGGEDGGGDRPFANLLDAITTGNVPQFISIGTDLGENRLVRSALIEVLEIPMGVLMPDIYADHAGDDDLRSMQVAGTA